MGANTGQKSSQANGSASAEQIKQFFASSAGLGPDGGMMIPAIDLANLMEQTGLSQQQIMVALLPIAASYARSPVSDFQVGAIAMGLPVVNVAYNVGNLYLGASFEFCHEALSFVVHGEQSATHNAWVNGEQGLQFLSISAPPCGYCRQFLLEISTAMTGFTVLLATDSTPFSSGYTSHLLTELVPVPFGPKNLGMTNSLMLARDNGLSHPGGDALIEATVSAANHSYAVYSNDCSAVGLQTSAGVIITGRYAENAAYNPSLSPLEGALSQLNLTLATQATLDIARAVLVEKQSKVSQLSVSEDVLSVTAPGIQLEHMVI